MSVLQDSNLERLLATLHAASDAQTSAIRQHYDERDRAVDRPPVDQAARTKSFLSDKLYALDRDKAEFCYQLCRAIDARRIVEIGTSYGVSTLYLAAAVRDNIRAGGGDGVVISTVCSNSNLFPYRLIKSISSEALTAKISAPAPSCQ
jgi:predicted O-methyltransferase YrrM